MADRETDKELVKAFLRGEAEAFNLLVWRWQRPLYNFLLRLTGERETAQDICQEAFLRAYTRMKDLREQEKFSAWLFRIAVNRYRSDRRNQHAMGPPGSNAVDLPDVADGPANRDKRELQLTVRALISQLPSEQREVLLLKVFHGFRFDEIAAILECPASTLKSRLYKAFEQLRAGLERQTPHPRS